MNEVLDANQNHSGNLSPRLSLKLACSSEIIDEQELMEEYSKEGIVHSLTSGSRMDGGVLTCADGGLFFDGEINGDLVVSGTLIVGVNGVVRGSVTAANIYNFGVIEGKDVVCEGAFVNRGMFSGSLTAPSNRAPNYYTSPKRKFLGGIFAS